VQFLQKENFTEADLDTLESNAEEYQTAKLKSMPCQTVEFHKLSAHLRDYITKFGKLQNGVHVSTKRIEVHSSTKEVELFTLI
jgi:hypothetical protein